MAQWFDAKVPKAMQASISRQIAAVMSCTTATGRIMVENVSPVTVIVLRTRVGDAPERIQRSETQPAITVAPAMAKYAIEPTAAIRSIERWRSFTRYSGNQVNRKNQK